MPLISGRYDPAVGAITQVAILKAPPRVNGGTQKLSELRLFQALIDTGASCTCISQKVAEDLELQPIGKELMKTPAGEIAQNTCQFHVGFLVGQKQEPTGAVSGSLLLLTVKGSEFHNTGTGFEVLLGRDIICQGAFTLSFDGHYLLSLP